MTARAGGRVAPLTASRTVAVMHATAPLPGWYPDPWGPYLRWWDGWSWTPATVVPPPAPPAPIPVSPATSWPLGAWFGVPAALLASLITGLVTAVAVAAVTGSDLDVTVGDAGIVVTAGSMLGMWTVFGAAFAVACHRNGLSLIDGFTSSRRWIQLAALGVGVGFAARVPIWVIQFLLNAFSDRRSEGSGGIVDGFSSASPWAVLLLVAVVCVGAPLFEEMFFRGVLLTSMSRPLGVAGAVAVQGVVFGVAHFPQPLLALMVIGATGVAFGVLRVRSTSLVAPVVAHAVFNACAVAEMLLLT